VLIARLVRAHYRRHPAHWLGLAAFVALAALALHAGLVLATDYPTTYDRQAAAAQSPDFAVLEPQGLWSDRQTDSLDRDPRVARWETEPVVAASAAARFNGFDLPATVMFSALDRPRDLDLPTPLAGARPLDDGGVYLPYAFEVGGGYRIGDRFAITIAGVACDWEVAGFTNEVFFGSTLRDWYRLSLTGNAWDRLAAQAPGALGVLLSVGLADGAEAGDTDRVYLDYMTGEVYTRPTGGADRAAPPITSATRQETRLGRMAFTTLSAGTLTLFAGLLLVASLTVIRFRVVATIEETTADIGSLKATGFTSGQIAASLVAAFGLVAGVAATLGIVGAQALTRQLADALAVQSALPWDSTFAPGVAGVTALVVVGSVVAVVGLAARRVHRLSPVAALRAGLAPVPWRHDSAPLDASAGPLVGLLALKQARQAVGQLVVIGAILAIVATMTAFTVDNYDNMGRDRFAYATSLLGQTCDVLVWTAPGQAGDLAAQLRGRPGVARVLPYDTGASALVGGKVAGLLVTEDFSQVNRGLIRGGRPPAAADEVAVTERLASLLGKKVGDTVDLVVGGLSAGYTITGFVQLVTDSGFVVALSQAGLLRIDPGFRGSTLYVFLDDPTQSTAFLDGLKTDPQVSLQGGADLRRAIDARMGPASDLLSTASKITLAAAVGITALVVFLVVTTALRRRRHDFGVRKAIGFTTGQLIAEVTATYAPVAAVATAAGAALGHGLYGPAISWIMSPLGLQGVLTRPPWWLAAVVAVGLTLFAVATVALLAARLRHVTPRALVAE